MKESNLIFDSASVRSIDANGFMHVALTPISKATVNPYLGREVPGWQEQGLEADRIYYGLRDPEELKKAAPTFNGLPVLMDHHAISADNPAKEHVVGSTGTDAVYDAPYLKNSLSITDADAITAIEDGSMKEISCCYSFVPDYTPGEYNVGGEAVHYDFVMRDILGNHVALVEEGRAGHDVKVADCMPRLKITKKGEVLEMNKKQRMLAFKRRRNCLAQDANLGIEAAEVLSAGFQKALNAVEAQVEGYDPREVGLDVDKEATIEQIVDKFMPGLDAETKEIYKGVLLKLKGEDAVETKDEEQTVEKSLAEEQADEAKDEEQDERFKDPVFLAGFEAGVKYGEKREKTAPERIDEEHESEGEKRYLGEDTIAKVKAQVQCETIAAMRKLNTAAAKVRPLVGVINDPMAFDSAESIYAFALRQAGKNPESYPKEAYAGMVDVLLENPAPQFIGDSRIQRGGSFSESTIKAFGRLKNITV